LGLKAYTRITVVCERRVFLELNTRNEFILLMADEVIVVLFMGSGIRPFPLSFSKGC